METCKTCRNWEPPENDSFGDVPGVGRCGAVPHYWDAGDWDDMGERRILKPEYKDVLAFAQDASDYRASLMTMPNFGCVMHARRKD